MDGKVDGLRCFKFGICDYDIHVFKRKYVYAQDHDLHDISSFHYWNTSILETIVDSLFFVLNVKLMVL